MSSDYIRVNWDDEPVFVNAYRVNAVVLAHDGATQIVLNSGTQLVRCDESPEEVVAMLDQVVNGSTDSMVKLSRSFPGMGE